MKEKMRNKDKIKGSEGRKEDIENKMLWMW